MSALFVCKFEFLSHLQRVFLLRCATMFLSCCLVISSGYKEEVFVTELFVSLRLFSFATIFFLAGRYDVLFCFLSFKVVLKNTGYLGSSYSHPLLKIYFSFPTPSFRSVYKNGAPYAPISRLKAANLKSNK